MSQFLNELKYVPAPRVGFFQLTEALHYYSSHQGKYFTAPSGFVTNFVTGKKLLVVRRIVQEKMNRAAVIHDELYTSGLLPRLQADYVFFEAMRADGVAWWRASLAYAAVMAVGWKFYKATPSGDPEPA